LQLETNTPGLVVAVTVDGKEVWTKGLYQHQRRQCELNCWQLQTDFGQKFGNWTSLELSRWVASRRQNVSVGCRDPVSNSNWRGAKTIRWRHNWKLFRTSDS